MTTIDEFLTPEQVSKQIGVSIRTLGRWEALRCGPPRVKIGKLVLYRREAIRTWLQANESRPVAMAGGCHV